MLLCPRAGISRYCSETPSIPEMVNRALDLNCLSATKGFCFLVYAFVSAEIFYNIAVPRDMAMHPGGWHNDKILGHEVVSHISRRPVSLFLLGLLAPTNMWSPPEALPTTVALSLTFSYLKSFTSDKVLHLSQDLFLRLLFPAAYFHINCRNLITTPETSIPLLNLVGC